MTQKLDWMRGCATAIITPFKKDGSVDDECLKKLVERQIKGGVKLLVPCGTTGESATMDEDERLHVIRLTVEVAKRLKAHVIAGTGSNNTAATIDFTRKAREAGADCALVVAPYYNKPTQEGMYRHFCAVADAVDKPVMLYNVPGRTVADLLPPTVGRLAQHPRIFGIKEATGDLARIAQIRAAAGTAFALYSGDDASAREFIGLGGQGVVSVTANVAPAEMAQMCRAALAGRAEEAAQLDRRLASLHRDLFLESNPIPVKWVLERMGRIPSGIRLPLTPLSPASRPALEAAMRQAGLL